MKLSLILILFCFCQANSQTLKGIVVDENSTPLSHVNVSIQSLNIGVYSNVNGFFELDINHSNILIFSHIGYKTKKISAKEIKDFSKRLTIVLNSKTEKINEVVVSSKKKKLSKTSTLGTYKKVTKFGSSSKYGFQSAIWIKNPKKNRGKLMKVIFYVDKNNKYISNKLTSLPVHYKLKFYDYNVEKNTPGKLLSYEDIIVIPKGNKYQKISVDLSSFNILFPANGVCVGIEAINPNPVGKRITKYTTYPDLIWTYAPEKLSWINYRGGDNWHIKKYKYPYTHLFQKEKFAYANVLLQLKVKYFN